MRRLALLLAGLVAGCTIGPDFREPADHAPGQWWGGAQEGIIYGQVVDATWWTRFEDPELTVLVGRLARQNLNLAQAAERVQQGRAQRRIVASEGFAARGFARFLHADAQQPDWAGFRCSNSLRTLRWSSTTGVSAWKAPGSWTCSAASAAPSRPSRPTQRRWRRPGTASP